MKDWYEFSENGRYPSPFPAWPGYMQLPNPFGLEDYIAWKKAMESGTADKDRGSVNVWVAWQALRAVATFSLTDLHPERNPPLDVVTWAIRTADNHIATMMDPKEWRGRSSTTTGSKSPRPGP
jgi:hypothetical protein